MKNLSIFEIMILTAAVVMTIGSIAVWIVMVGERVQWVGRALCAIGIHGPNWYGPNYGYTRNPVERRCPHCDKRWYGTTTAVTVNGQTYRVTGNFKPHDNIDNAGELE